MEVLLVIAGVAALVWGAVLLRRGGLLAGCLAVLVAGALFGRPFFHVDLGPLPLTADRLLWTVLLVAYFVWRRWGLADPKPAGWPEVLLVAFLGVLAVSTFTHDWQAKGYQAVAWLAFFYVMPAGVYCVARQTRLTERGVMTSFAVLGVLGVYLAVTALAEVRGVWWLVYPKYIASPENPDFFGRGRGPLLNPIGCGFFQAVCLFAAVMWWPKLGRAGRLGLVAATLLVCLGTYSTLTRSTWMGLGLGLAIVVGLAVPRSWRLPLLGTGLVAAALVVATNWDRLVAFQRDKGHSASETAKSVALRPILARVAWNMFCDRPLLGCGFSHYRDRSKFYLGDRSTDLPLERARPYVQHNVLLSLLAETGLVGMGLFAALLAAWGWDGWRLWRARGAPLWARQQGLFLLAALGAYLPNAMFHEVSLIPTFNVLLFLAAGVTAGLRPLAQPGAAAVPATGRSAPSATGRGFRVRGSGFSS